MIGRAFHSHLTLWQSLFRWLCHFISDMLSLNANLFVLDCKWMKNYSYLHTQMTRAVGNWYSSWSCVLCKYIASFAATMMWRIFSEIQSTFRDFNFSPWRSPFCGGHPWRMMTNAGMIASSCCITIHHVIYTRDDGLVTIDHAVVCTLVWLSNE